LRKGEKCEHEDAAAKIRQGNRKTKENSDRKKAKLAFASKGAILPPAFRRGEKEKIITTEKETFVEFKTQKKQKTEVNQAERGSAGCRTGRN